MVVECTQTAHQKETVNLIKDFFELANYNFPQATGWGNGIISRLFGVTGIKFDKPFIAEVFEGRFTTSSLLEKYPISKSQVMYIFTIIEHRNYRTEEIEYRVGATRVYNSGKVYTDESTGNEKYFNFDIAPTYDKYFRSYDYYIKTAMKTLVLVADRENVVEREHRKLVLGKENTLIQHIACGYRYDYIGYETLRVKWVEREDNTDWVALREGSGKKYEYEYADYCEHFDKSGYCVVALRESLIYDRLRYYSSYLKLRKIVKTDYSQKLRTRYDEIIVLKNLIATSIINNTDLKTLKKLSCLTDKITDVIDSHEDIMRKLKKSKEIYEECEHKSFKLGFIDYGHYDRVADVKEDLKDLDSSIAKIKTELFDKILQQDI
jgi:hypothetical protein